MRTIKTFVSQSWPSEPTFSVDQIPDLSGRVVLVTGGNAGIGYETAKAVLSKNAKVYIACRSREKGESALARLRQETGKEGHFLKLDLASLVSIREAASEFLRLETKLHILFNNAGVMEPPVDLLTAEGYDMTIGTNVLGPYYLTTLLLPALLAVPSSSDGNQKARIVNTSSFGSEIASKVDYTIFKDNDKKRRALGPSGLYLQSKWLNIVFTKEFSRRYGDKGIVSSA
ncbi:short-chain alcohol dehydrogenase, partial [Marasmius sp. AFHP31]